MRTRIKVQRRFVEVSDNDSMLLDNGACFQLMDVNLDGKWYFTNVTVSKTLINVLKKHNCIYTNATLKQAATNNHGSFCTYWKFNVSMMQEQLGYQVEE